TELAGDDRGMAGAAAEVGHDAGRLFQHGLPVGTCRLGDQNLARLERFQILGGGDEACLSAGKTKFPVLRFMGFGPVSCVLCHRTEDRRKFCFPPSAISKVDWPRGDLYVR